MHYDKRDPRNYNNAMGRYTTDRQMHFLRRHLKGAGSRVLDIGGGNGRLAVPLAALGHNVTVADESEMALRQLAEERQAGIECAPPGDILSFRAAAPFDLVLASDTVKYMQHASHRMLFGKFREFLTDGGVFILAEMNTASWRYAAARLLNRRTPYNIDSRRGYAASLQAVGFEIIEMRGYRWLPFAYNSNSPFVPLLARLENLLQLHRWASQSPWLLIAARRIALR
jgi:2-polyprenyl-3-methyl-5-hydroxy-6-metoxy-1,4-benzoquinol methylase